MQFLRKSKQIVGDILIKIDSIRYSFRLSRLAKLNYYGYSGKLKVVDQLANPDPILVESYYGKISDSAAAVRFGTKDLSKYSYWAWRSCGVANVATILETTGNYSGSLYALAMQIKADGGYLESDRWGNTDIGWKHEALRQTLEEHGVEAQVVKYLSRERLLDLVSSKAMVTVSIRSRISKEGSHMITVYGFQWDGNKTKLSIYDPYTFDNKGGIKTINLSEFSKYFLNKGIITWPLKTS